MVTLKIKRGKKAPLHSSCVVLIGQFYVLDWNLWLHDLPHCNPRQVVVWKLHIVKHTVAIKLKCPWPLVAGSQMDIHPKHTVSCDRNLDSWPGSLNLTGSRPCARWNMEDIRFTLTLAFSTSDFHMHFQPDTDWWRSPLSFLLRDAHSLNNESKSAVIYSIWQSSLLASFNKYN